jgi:hypothetical protein
MYQRVSKVNGHGAVDPEIRKRAKVRAVYLPPSIDTIGAKATLANLIS